MSGFDLSTTPGAFYAVAYWLGVMLYIYQNPRRLQGWKLYVTQGVFLLGLTVFMLLTNGVPKPWFLPCMALTVGTVYAFIMVCCDIDAYRGAYCCVRSFILSEFAASLEWQLFYYGVTQLGLPKKLWMSVLMAAVVYLLAFGAMFVIERRYGDGGQPVQITKKELLPVLAIGGFVYAISNLSYAYTNTPFSSDSPAEIFIIRTLVDLGGVGILFAHHRQLQELNAKLEVETLKNILHMQYTNYQLSVESIALVNQKYHDLKHQIALLRSEVTSQEKLAYLDQMENEIKSYEAQNKTGNQVLDTLLASKSLQCQSQGVSLTCVADGKALDFMQPMDICTLFGNALDNAVENVNKLPDPEKRLIHVSVSRQKDFLRIRVENYYEGSIEFVNGLPATTKNNKQFHGFGLKSIQSTAKKYGGSVTISAENGWFELRVLIPLQQRAGTAS